MSDSIGALRSAVSGQVWPGLPSARGATLAALLYQFERTQWLTPDELTACQMRQLACLLDHARRTVPFYRERLAGFPDTPDPANWRDLPALTRRTVQAEGAALHSTSIPREFGAIRSAETSGSTGEPVKVRCTDLDRLMWDAMTLRDHYWHARDFSAKLASIRVFDGPYARPPAGTICEDWGEPASELHATGPMAMLALDTDVAVQALWLQEHEPAYLLTYPTNLDALIDHAQLHGWSPQRLREVRTVGETVTAELRARCRAAWGVAVVDVYSSRELGYIALQCPDSELYHVVSETMFVEVIGTDGRPVRPGEIGRLIVTPLHNYATPLVRYELNDYAEAGPPCPCGRGLPTLARILGRTRNMVVLPDGRRHWPLVGFGQYRAIAPVKQYQFVQRTVRDIDVRLVTERLLSGEEQARLREVMTAALGHPFALHFQYFDDEIPRGPGGKFEEFISLVPH